MDEPLDDPIDDNNVLMGKFIAAISADAPYLKNVEFNKPSDWSRNIAEPKYLELDNFSFKIIATFEKMNLL